MPIENNLEEIILGSGDLYAVAFAGEIPDHATIETDSNLLGRISGGASIEYKFAKKSFKDDSGKVNKTFIISEEASLKSGVMTWCLALLNKLTASGSYTDTVRGTTRIRTLKIGGKAGRALSKYLLRFVHEKESGYKLRCTMVGTAASGFKVDFKPEDATIVDAEFEAVSHDDEGTIIIFEEEYGNVDTLRELVVTSVAGSSAGNTHITIDPALADGCSYKYKVAANPTLPTFDQVLTSGWTAWDGSADITAATGQKIVVAEVTTADNKARGAGMTTIVAA